MNKGQLSHLLRKVRLIGITDRVRFYLQRFKYSKTNHDFEASNPNVRLPPDYLMYESFRINYAGYYNGGLDTARWLLGHFTKHIDLKDKRILDWGCGPGRIIRHLPALIGNGCEYFGTDYNAASIDWCSRYLPGITFSRNSLEAGLSFPDHFFDVVYGISVLTHLSEQLHHDWYKELYRVLKPNGILFFTTQGDNFKAKLTQQELRRYNRNELIVRGNTREGHRTYSAFHPAGFMARLFDHAEILEHIVTKPATEKSLPQDIWIIKKSAMP
jgi:SAM-dependent methyltransferase